MALSYDHLKRLKLNNICETSSMTFGIWLVLRRRQYYYHHYCIKELSMLIVNTVTRCKGMLPRDSNALHVKILWLSKVVKIIDFIGD
jgi:hypothetical protein